MQVFMLLAVLYLGLMLALGAARFYDSDRRTRPGSLAPAPAGTGQRWFQSIKPYCNSVEVLTAVQRTPPPEHRDSPGYQAACYALAGRIAEADAILAARSAKEAHHAAGIVFHVGHPVADAGDDDSAGPIMRLVVRYQPRNFMALYHAGISSYNLGDLELARDHLQRFLDLYDRNDGWRANGLTVLRRIERGERGHVASAELEK